MTDWQFYSSVERIWLCIRLNNELTQDADFGKKKITFSDEVHFDLGGYVNKQNCRIWGTENRCAYIEKTTQPKRHTVWCGFWSRDIIGLFFFENKQGEAVTVNGNSYRTMLNEFLFTKIEFGFNRTALSVTYPKLLSMFCALFLKITLSAAELMSFGHLGAAIWHRWTIICGVPSKISVKVGSHDCRYAPILYNFHYGLNKKNCPNQILYSQMIALLHIKLVVVNWR